MDIPVLDADITEQELAVNLCWCCPDCRAQRATRQLKSSDRDPGASAVTDPGKGHLIPSYKRVRRKGQSEMPRSAPLPDSSRPREFCFCDVNKNGFVVNGSGGGANCLKVPGGSGFCDKTVSSMSGCDSCSGHMHTALWYDPFSVFSFETPPWSGEDEAMPEEEEMASVVLGSPRLPLSRSMSAIDHLQAPCQEYFLNNRVRVNIGYF